jgi:hypothetical protein
VYRKVDPDGTPPESFEFPQGGKLASDNRWVMMAQLIAKQRRPTQSKKRTAIKKQLQYIKRNLAHIEKLIELGSLLEN